MANNDDDNLNYLSIDEINDLYSDIIEISNEGFNVAFTCNDCGNFWIVDYKCK